MLEMVSPIMRLLLSLWSRYYKMKPNSLPAKPVLRVTNALGGTNMETLATPRIGAMDEEGPTDVGPNSWTLAAMGAMGGACTLFISVVVPP